MTIGIVGGGASGLTAAIAAKRTRPQACVTVLERGPRVGRKLMLTGNGRCNLTNADAGPERYHGASPAFVRGILEQMTPADTLRFFADIGVPARTEEHGKVYPMSGQASSVADALRFEAERLGVSTRVDTCVTRMRPKGKALELACSDGPLTFDSVVLACGGRAGLPDEGAGTGYELLSQLGHRITSLAPAIVQVRTEPHLVRQLSGIRLDARAAAVSGGRSVRSEAGEVLFTDYGLSGPAVLQLSRAFSMGQADRVALDLMPDVPQEDVLGMLRFRRKRFAERKLEEYVSGMLSKRLGQVVLKYAGLSLSAEAAGLTEEEMLAVLEGIKRFTLRVTGVNGFQQAQVTAGGADTGQFDPATLASRVVPGLFACGEVLDVDGDCGGYNLQWAWSSGWVAGTNAAKAANG